MPERCSVVHCQHFFFNNTPATEIYTLSLHDALPIYLPIILDPSHALGYRYGIEKLAKACVAMGIDGLLIEAHPDPSVAKSDAAQQLTHEQFVALKSAIEPVAASVGYNIV